MDMLKAKAALVFRCPGVSDGAKVTMLEVLLQQNGSGVTPSLNELGRMRGISRSTVQAHLDEWIEAGVLVRKVGLKNKVRSVVRMSRLLRLNGLTDVSEVYEWTHSQAPESRQPEAVKSMLKDPENWSIKDAWAYFVLLGRRKKIRLGKMSPKDYVILRNLLTEYGGKILHGMLLRFHHNFIRMKREYTIAELRSVKERLL